MPPRASPGSTGSGGRGRGRGGGAAGGGRGGAPRGTSPQAGGPRGGGRGGRGSSRGAPPSSRGGPPSVGGGPPFGGGPSRAPVAGAAVLPDPNPHITTVGVKRPAFGSSGRTLLVYTNHYNLDSIPDGNIYHYDVIVSPASKPLPASMNMRIIERLQKVAQPDIFTPRAVYDGRKNLFSSRELPFGPSQEFDVTLSDPASPGQGGGEAARPPKVYKVKLTRVAIINPEVLVRFTQGKQSHDNTTLTAIMALNVVVRMEPSQQWPFNVRSFFTNHETADIGGGIVLWRGYFQSVRPAIGRMLINVDISTGAMYKPGPVISVALEALGRRPGDDPNLLSPGRGFPERERIKLQKYLSGVRVNVNVPAPPPNQRGRPPRVVTKLTNKGATELFFNNREGTSMSVAQYFAQAHNYRLRFPNIICLQIGTGGAIIPLECCTIPEGQIMRKQVPPEKVNDVLDFSTKPPAERLASIRQAFGVLNYGQSEYVRQFGMAVSPNAEPQSLQARVLEPPTLRYAGRQPTIKPRDGAWNMIDKHFIKPSRIRRWLIVIYEREQRFRIEVAREMVQGLLTAFASVGMQVDERDPVIAHQHSAGSIADQLRELGRRCMEKNRREGGPDLIVVVLPEVSADMYTAIKHFGDITMGVATQCLRSSKCARAKMQYFANVCLKINVKLGGINTVPDGRSVPALSDPHNPTIVMGADVIHPAPGTEGRPSFTALVGNVDSDTAKYVADCRAQTGRREMIHDLKDMAKDMIGMYQMYRREQEKKDPNPKRIIFYRDGVSEGEFQQVIDTELKQLKEALQELRINAKITLLVVGKRHHVRFFPQRREDADRSGNCPAGLVVDSNITHPTEFDFYLQSHAGLKGTSRPAHYTVLYDENKFTPDNLQALSFALCHVYARSTRSVSIPAPVYYADIVCARAKHHYDPEGSLKLEESATNLASDEAHRQLNAYQTGFKKLNPKMRRVMYFS